MNTRISRAPVTLLACLAAIPAASALNVAGPAYGGAGICGVNNTATRTALGTPRANAGTTANINDGNAATRVDTFLSGYTGTLSYAGIVWPFRRADYIKSVTMNMACFSDGGWFGFTLATPGAGNPLTSAQHLLEPSLQVTTDGGVTWTAVDATTDYLTQLEGHPIGGGASPNPNPKQFTITLDTPVTGINGVRIIGENGGPADGNGFLGIIEVGVDAGPLTDVDADGMDDGWEDAHGLNKAVNDAALDLDSDGLANGLEFLAATDPQDTDTDNDGLTDGVEVNTWHSNPNSVDSDGDGLNDGAEVNTYGSNPVLTDSDGDGLADGAEVNTYGSNPASTDSDGDQFTDGLEVARGFNPASAASRPANIAIQGSGLMGLNDAIDTDGGTIHSQQGTTAAILNRLVNENFTDRIDTFDATRQGNYSFVGVTWPTARALPLTRVEVTLACFADGGWWGKTNDRPGLTGADVRILTAANLPVAADMPVVQVTTVSNPAWTTIPSTTNYDTAAGVLNQPLGGGPIPSPTSRTISFNITNPATDASQVTGVRVIGREGGTAGSVVTPDVRGFLGVWEVVVKDTASSDDLDSDGVNSAAEATAGSDPNLPDSDFDGLTDRQEIVTYNTSPIDNDTDDDGFLDSAEVALGTNPLQAASRPANIARAGIGTTGINNLADTDNGTTVINSATPAAPAVLFPTFFTASTNVNDGNVNTRVDTFNASIAFSFVGVRWPNLWPQPVSRLELQMATFFDGGWFGANSSGPGSGAALTATQINNANLPIVQVSTDGIVWTSTLPGGAAVTTDYLTKMTGHVIGGGAAGNPTRSPKCIFTIDPPIPANSIKAIRIIGREGGTASGGFLGVFDLNIQDTTTSNDLDQDGLTNAQEVTLGTDPENSDTDGDGLLDGAEVNTYGSNPRNQDTDGDLFRDGVEVQYSANPASAASFPDNVALLGSAIMGIAGTIDSNPGVSQFQAGVITNVNDGNPATRVDTWNTAGGINSYVGILWTAPQTIKTLRMNFATFFDGGWFGPNGLDPGNGGALNATYLSEPTIQITVDGGVTWSTVPHTSNYLTVMDGHLIGNTAAVNPTSRVAVFTLNSAAVVNGVRLIGSEGGTASGGFLGCFEFEVGQGPVAGDADNDGLPDVWEIAAYRAVHLQHLRSDGDGDGSDNLLEYAFGLNAAVPDVPPAGVVEGGYLTMTIAKKPGIAYSVASGSDLNDFSEATTTVLVNDASTLKVRDNTPIGTGPRRFLKTTVSPAP